MQTVTVSSFTSSAYILTKADKSNTNVGFGHVVRVLKGPRAELSEM